MYIYIYTYPSMHITTQSAGPSIPWTPMQPGSGLALDPIIPKTPALSSTRVYPDPKDTWQYGLSIPHAPKSTGSTRSCVPGYAKQG